MDPISILFEDEQILVLHKPSGIPSVPKYPKNIEEEGTAVRWAFVHSPGLRAFGYRPGEYGLVHRLDTGTSGLLVFAKNADIFSSLRRSWKTEEVQKVYRARVGFSSALPRLPMRLNLKLAHSRKSKKKMIVLTENQRRTFFRGKPLETITEIQGVLCEKTNEWIELEILIQTGVMHQIRCSLAHLGVPIVGDKVYGGARASRLYLHAERIRLPKMTERNNPLELFAPLPSDWK